jgi:hypothetical protein
MTLFKVYGNELYSEDVRKETECFYFLHNYVEAFGGAMRIDKVDAMLTPQEAIGEALNHSRTMFGAYTDKAKSAERDIEKLSKLAKEHGMLREL